MARQRPTDGFQRLLDAGLEAFAKKGLHATRMSDVAASMGVSAGTLYQYVESKEALFFVLVDRGLGDAPVPLPEGLPLKAPPQARVLERLAEQMAEHSARPKFQAALMSDAPKNARDELTGIAEELFDFTARTRRWVDVIERSTPDVPDIAAMFAPLREVFFATMTSYIDSRMTAGAFRKDVDAAVAARFLVETITFFARHRHNDPNPIPLDETKVRASTTALVVDSLLKKR